MTNKWLTILAVLLVATGWAKSAEFYTPPVVCIPYLEHAPQIDGVLTAEEWHNAAVLSQFVAVGGNSRPQLPTTVYLAYTNEALYVGADLFDPQPQQLRQEVSARDGEVWRDDCLELFIDTEGKRSHYARLVVNSLGTKYDSYDRVASEDFQWEAAAAVGDDGWSVEVRLPFANQVPPRPEDKWILELARNAARADVLSSWGLHDKSFHEPQNFGTLIFGGRPWRVQINDLGAMWLGKNNAFVSFRPLYELPAEGESAQLPFMKLNVRVMGRDERAHHFDSVKQTLPADSPQLAVPYLIKQDGFNTVAFSLTDHEGTVRWRSSPYPVQIPPVSSALAQAEQKLGDALVSWAKMPEGISKQRVQKLLEEMLMGWQALHQRYQKRQQMQRTELETLLRQVQLISEQAQALMADIAAASPAQPQ